MKKKLQCKSLMSPFMPFQTSGLSEDGRPSSSGKCFKPRLFRVPKAIIFVKTALLDWKLEPQDTTLSAPLRPFAEDTQRSERMDVPHHGRNVAPSRVFFPTLPTSADDAFFFWQRRPRAASGGGRVSGAALDGLTEGFTF
ncbi:hypothetical protein EYF80_014484 [Liparis tanakae]|uniref:Uncharacterized protein n=1 Tax=Liparis tanakae TaxID=230148 RepID=A0A4Z2IBA4_9TELE|nr:hypothetical protein EYF80_014484 [Liparis tanakae]